ncbi:MAG: hypothetical protein ACK4UW_12970, partial [Rhizobium rhizophilum]|uniref:hypothetical protein n=1 Tax=Rhizobium rhizophilum TaxID=1850373 RepID=UPI00391DAC10
TSKLPIFQRFSRTKDFVASSAAALVSERMYRFASPTSQQASPIKFQKIDKSLNIIGFSDDKIQTGSPAPENGPLDLPWTALKDRHGSWKAVPHIRVGARAVLIPYLADHKGLSIPPI